jgi:hypothetical protein
MTTPATETLVSRSKFFEFVSDCDAYQETENKNDAEPYTVKAGFQAFVDPTERLRLLNRRNVSAVVFSIDILPTYFWMPKDRFYSTTKEKQR